MQKRPKFSAAMERPDPRQVIPNGSPSQQFQPVRTPTAAVTRLPTPTLKSYFGVSWLGDSLWCDEAGYRALKVSTLSDTGAE